MNVRVLRDRLPAIPYITQALALLATVAALLVPSVVRSDVRPQSMRGLRAVAVTVDISSPSEEFVQLVTESAVRTNVELRLRQAGVRVVSPHDLRAVVGTLAVSITALQIQGTPMYAISVSESLLRDLWRVVDGRPVEYFVAETWDTASTLVQGRSVLAEGGAGGLLNSSTDEFLNVWLASHPKTQ